MSQFFCSEPLYVAIPGLGGTVSSHVLAFLLYVAICGLGAAVCRNSWARRNCMSQFLVSVELYVAIPGLGGAVCRNSCVFMSAEVSCPSEYAQAQVVSSVAGPPRSVVS